MYAPPPMNGMQREWNNFGCTFLEVDNCAILRPAHGYPPGPPPGPYPPNGAPRGSVPPTPIQQHTYAYHQSPQSQ